MKSESKQKRSKAARRRGGVPSAAGVELVFEGLGVSAGIAIGEAHLVETGAIQVPEYEIAESDVEK